ncbi:MAG: hypothetical protein Q8K79_09260 [Solirubrobacteraceae bacterium]|nr:hypothetical protein [Solirubrobacteraceae bacterium]
MDDDAIRELVIRLSRSDGRGGHTIERATLRAEGTHLTEIVKWIEAHGGVAEAPAAAPRSSGGLHGGLRGNSATAVPGVARYVLPAGTLS